MRKQLFSLQLIILMLGTASFADQRAQKLVDGETSAGEMSFTYKFENPRFYIRVIEIDLDASGAGQLRFIRGESDEVLDSKVKLLPPTVARIRQLFDTSSFLMSQADYQDKKDFSHLGWVTLGAQQGARRRTTRFNFTTNLQMKELGDIFRGIASQEMALFDIENAERYQPLDLPKQLENLENDLRLERIAEPERLLAALNEIAGDDSQPLIARNQAKKIAEAIKKAKFKSPVKRSS